MRHASSCATADAGRRSSRPCPRAGERRTRSRTPTRSGQSEAWRRSHVATSHCACARSTVSWLLAVRARPLLARLSRMVDRAERVTMLRCHRGEPQRRTGASGRLHPKAALVGVAPLGLYSPLPQPGLPCGRGMPRYMPNAAGPLSAENGQRLTVTAALTSVCAGRARARAPCRTVRGPRP